MTPSAKPNYPAWLRTRKEPCSFTFVFLALNTPVLRTFVDVLVPCVTAQRGPAAACSRCWGCPELSRDRAGAIENRNRLLWHQGLPGTVSHCLFPKACSEFSLGLCAFQSKFWCGRKLWHVLTSGFKSWPLRAIELDMFCTSNLCSKTVLWSSSGQSNLSNTCIWKPLGLLIIFLE